MFPLEICALVSGVHLSVTQQRVTIGASEVQWLVVDFNREIVLNYHGPNIITRVLKCGKGKQKSQSEAV